MLDMDTFYAEINIIAIHDGKDVQVGSSLLRFDNEAERDQYVDTSPLFSSVSEQHALKNHEGQFRSWGLI